MHYRVESAALPRAKAFKNVDMAVAFAKALAKQTTHEVRVRIVEPSHSIDKLVLFVFNERPLSGSE